MFRIDHIGATGRKQMHTTEETSFFNKRIHANLCEPQDFNKKTFQNSRAM